MKGNKSIFLSSGLSWTSFLNREPGRELFADDTTDDAYANDVPEGCGVSPEVKEKVVALFPDLAGGENGIIRYLLDEALELTEFVWLRAETGLFISPRC